jgi:phage replication-related protein YjqB (UPF0714/DUF867 family)
VADKYSSFEQLSTSEPSDSYQILHVSRETSVAIIAPHAGKIEPGTSEISRAIAGEDLTLYLFEGCKSASNSDLHITSNRFDEPDGLVIASSAHTVLTIHGQRGDDLFINVGGLNEELGDRIIESLNAAGYVAGRHADPTLQGTNKENICNRGKSGSGVQLEISRGLRNQLCNDALRLAAFSEMIRKVLLLPEPSNS